MKRIRMPFNASFGSPASIACLCLSILRRKKRSLVSVFLVLSQILSPVGMIIVYAAPTVSNNVGSGASLDPVGNKATRLQTQGSSGVDKSSGALTYSYPLTIPEGRGGMSPKLTLSYNSQNNDSGWFGYGWTTSIPYIERTAKTGSDKLYTNPVFVSSLHGELTSADGISYEQKVDDGSYAKYTYSGNTWQMVDRDGTTYYFGNTYSSRVQDDSGTKIGRWYLTEVRDKFGNGIVYSYTKDSGTVYPSTISYTEHAMAHPLNLITFTLEDKNDKIASYKYGFKTIDTKRVTSIKATTNGKDNTFFSFVYTTGSNGVRSLLQSIEEKHLSTNDDWTTLPKTTFEYEKSPITFSGTISNSSNPYGSNSIIDTNNDGILETYNAGDGYYPVDINGDYKKDLVQSDVTYGAYSNGLTVNFKYNQGGTFFLRSLIKPYAPAYLRSFPTGNPAPPLRYMAEGSGSWSQESAVADVNGDGFDDIVYNDPYGSNGVAINTTNNTFDYSTSTALWFNIGTDQLADMNGDGLQDKISKSYTATSTLYSVYLNNGSSYNASSSAVYDAGVASSSYDIGVRFVDVNNDGLPDVVRSYNSSSTGGSCPINQTKNEILLNTGSGFVTSSSTLSGYLVTYSSCGAGNSTKEYDTNGDLTVDYDSSTNNTAKQDVLKKVTGSLGPTLDVSYNWTPQTGLNPTLPVPMQTVGTTTEKLSSSDTNPHIVSYKFSNGQMYYDETNPRDHKFAGFGKVEVTDGNNKTVTYFHQGDGDDYTTGEKGDSYYNIGRAYRVDTFDLSTGTSTLVSKELSLYTTYSYASSSFTYLDSQITNLYNPDGTYVSSGSKNVYDEVKRLIKTTYNYGDIEPFISFASSTISDKGSDLLTTSYEYSNSRPQRLVKQVTTDYAGQPISNVNYYYDGLPYGLVDKGAVTSVLNTVYNTDGTVNSTSTTQTAYDPTGNIIQTTDSLNNTTKVIYDSSYFFPVAKIDALNGTTTYSYDPYTLNLLSTKGPDGITYAKETDGLGEVTRSYTMDSGNGIYDEVKTSYVYGSGLSVYSRKTGTSGQDARAVEIYDSYGRLIQAKKETSPDVFSTQDTQYDASSNITSVSLPYTTRGYGFTTDTPANGKTTYTYDGLGRVASKSTFGTTIYYQYGARSLTVQDNASTQHKKSYTYDAQGNLSQVKEYNGADVYTTSYTYTPANKLSRITDADGNIRNFSYLSNGLLNYQEDPHAATDTTFTTYSYTYDSLGNLLTKTGPLGTITYVYDSLSRPLTRTTSDSTYGTSTVSLTYTGCANNYLSPCVIDRTTSSTTLSYSAAGRLNSETLSTDGKTFTRSYAYDIFGNPTTITYPDNGKAVYTYTLDGKQSSLSYITPSGTTKTIASNVAFNSLGDLSSLSLGNGVIQCNTYTSTSTDGVISPKLSKSAYLFNSTGCSSSGSNQIELYKDEFTYKDNLTPSNVLSTYKDIAGTTNTKSDTFTYDNLARLTGVSTSYNGGGAVVDSLTYDPIGDIIKENDVLYRYSTDGMQNAHAVTSIGGENILYDAQGNRIQVGDNSYAWNALNQLMSATSTNGTETYTYNENGERIKKVVQANSIINQKVTPSTASLAINGLSQGDLLAAVATSSTYIATSTYNTLSSLSLLDKPTLNTLVTDYYASPFTSKFCATATSTANRQACIATTTEQLLANDINARGTSTVASVGLITDIIKISTGEYLIPSSYSGIATSSIATSDNTIFTVDSGTISSYNTFVSTGVVVPIAEYSNLPYVSTSTYNSMLLVGLTDTSKVRALFTLAGCDSIVSACANAKEVVFEKYYKENGYLFSDKALQEMWYVYAAKARLPGNSGELTSTSTYLGNISVPTVTSISTSAATTTYYSSLYFATAYAAQNANEPRLPYFNTIPYYITQTAFNELAQAGITQTTIENYKSLIEDTLGIGTASSTEYMVALSSFAYNDKKATLSWNTLKEMYLDVLGAATVPENLNSYTDNSTFDLASYLSVQTVYGAYENTLSNTTTGCNGGSYSGGYARCKIRVSPFTLPVATSSTVTYLLSVTAPNPTDFILNAGESTNPTNLVDDYNYGTQIPTIYSSRYAPATYYNGMLDYVSGSISSDGWTQTIDVTSTIVKEKASSTEPSVILLMNRSGWTNGEQYAYQSLNTSVKAYVNTPRLTLASTTLVAGITDATTTSFTTGIQNTISAYFGENHDSSSDINVGTSSPLVFISPESYAEFASTTLRDAYALSKVFMATSTSQCITSASTTECDKQARKTAFRQIVANLSGFTPSEAATEEFWMVYKGILTLPNINYASTTATSTVAGYYQATSTIGSWLVQLAPGYYSSSYTASSTASTTITILNTQAGGTTFTPGTGSQYILAMCGSYCSTPSFNGTAMTMLVNACSQNTNSCLRIYGLATTTATSVTVTDYCGTYCGYATDHYRWASLKGLNASSFYYDIKNSSSNSASTLSVTENVQDKNNLTFVSSNISTTGTGGGSGSSPLIATTTSRLWYHYATTTGNFTYSVTGLGSTDAEVASIQMNHDPTDTLIPGYWTTNYIATTTTYYIATSSAQLPAIVSSTSTSYPVFSRANLPPTLSTTTSYSVSTTTVPGYWVTQVGLVTQPTGGTITTSGSSTIHTFTSSGTFVSPSSFNAQLLVVGGGGSGGYTGGGGGAGQYQYNSSFALTPQSYSVVVGGTAATSSFGTTTSIPGGAGGSNWGNGFSGASGGGGSAGNPGYGGTGTAGYNGANGDSANTGGGGGSSAAGSGRTGGAGTANSITGTSVTYAVGGGGGAIQCGPNGSPNGGTCGNVGGVGATPGSGGGGGAQNNNGGAGASGIVIVSYPTSLFQGTTTYQVYIATSTIVTPITHLDLVPPGLLSDPQFNTLYSTSSFALATSTRTVSQATYNELLHTPIRLNSDVKVVFNYALPYATSTCPVESATSTCVVNAQKTKVKNTISSLSGFVLSDAALEELYRVDNDVLDIVPVDLTGFPLVESSQTISLPLDASSTFMTFATSSGVLTQTQGICAFGTQGSTSSVCYIAAPNIKSPVTTVSLSYDFATSSIATSTVLATLTVGTSTATSTITGTKATSTFSFNLSSPYQTLATTSATLILSPNNVASSTIYSVTNPRFTLSRRIATPIITYDTSVANIAFSRSEISSLSTSTATTSLDLSTDYGLNFSTIFISPIGPTSTSTGTTTAYGSLVSTSSLQTYYKLDESSGNASDSSGNGNTATATSITYSSGNGKINNGAGFDGSNSLLTLSSGFTNLTGDWTKSFWIKRASGSVNEAIYSRWTNSTTGRQLLLYFNTDGTIGVEIPYIAGVLYSTSTYTDTSAYHNYVFTKSGTTWSLYYDGALVTSVVNASAQENSSMTPYIGRNSYGDRKFTGKMDEIGIWSRALSAQEVAGLYNSGSGVQYPFMGTTTISTSFLVYDANPSADTSNLLTYNSLPSVATTTSLGSVSYPNASSTQIATSTTFLLSQSTTTQYTTYTPFTNYVSDSRGFNTTYLTLNGTLVGAYTYQVGNEAGTGKLTFVATNYLGTPVLETDDKGDIVQMDITDVFGNYVQRDQRKDNAYHNKGYTGHEYDDTTNLIYAHARFLDTTAHTFLSVDPMIYSLPQSYLSDPQQMNSYAYARNNPIVYTDPTGMFSLSGTLLNIGKSAVGAVTGYVNSFIVNGQQTSNAINAWSQSFSNSAVNKILSYANNPVQTAKSDYSSAVSSASSYGSALKTNGAQIWNAQTTAQGDAAMNGPAGGLIKTAATFGAVKAMEVAGGMAKASQIVDIAQSDKILHGNSLASQKPTWGYKLYSDSGELLKNGITSKLDPATRYTQSFMNDKIMTAELFENRAEAYLWEYTQNLIEKGPLNKNMH